MERICYGVELNPAYIDLIICRWERLTGKEALLDDGQTFSQVRAQRLDGDAQVEVSRAAS